MIKTMIALKDALTPKNLAWTKAPTRVTVNAVTQITRGNPGFSTVIEAWWPYRNSIGDIAGRDDVVFNIVLDEMVYQPHGKKAGDPLPAVLRSPAGRIRAEMELPRPNGRGSSAWCRNVLRRG